MKSIQLVCDDEDHPPVNVALTPMRQTFIGPMRGLINITGIETVSLSA